MLCGEVLTAEYESSVNNYEVLPHWQSHCFYLFIYFVFGKNCSDFEDNIPLTGYKQI